MQATQNYGFDIYEPNDVTSYLTTYNNTITKIDTDMKAIEDKADKGATDITGLEQQVSNDHDEINNLTGEVSDLQTTTQGHTSQIAAQNQRIDQQDIKIAAMQEGLVGGVPAFYSGVLTANEETLAITIGDHVDNLVVMPTTSVYGLAPKTIEVRAAAGGQPNLIVTTWDAQAEDVNVTMVVWDRTPAQNA